MPNWTTNELHIEPDWVSNQDKAKEEFIKFKDENIKLDIDNASSETTGEALFSFKTMLPIPKELEIEKSTSDESETLQAINKEKYGYESWYEFCIEKWGTKWDAAEPYIIESSEDVLIIRFETAWSPPLGWLEDASKKYKRLLFRMNVSEESNAFIGQPIARGGNLLANICRVDYPDGYDG